MLGLRQIYRIIEDYRWCLTQLHTIRVEITDSRLCQRISDDVHIQPIHSGSFSHLSNHRSDYLRRLWGGRLPMLGFCQRSQQLVRFGQLGIDLDK
jgi:hypothetical protein